MSYMSYEEMITEEARKGAKYAVVVFGWNQPRKVSFFKDREQASKLALSWNKKKSRIHTEFGIYVEFRDLTNLNRQVEDLKLQKSRSSEQ